MDGVVREKGQCINIRQAHRKKHPFLLCRSQEHESSEAEKGLPAVVMKDNLPKGFKGYAYVN